MNPILSLIAALSKNRVIGKDNKLPWHLPEDLKRFQALTKNHPIIMGRKTFESIGRVLSQRTNIVITRDTSWSHAGVLVSHSLEEALEVAKQHDSQEIFVIGGGQIFEQAIKKADKLYLTVVDTEIIGDAIFPDFSEFKKITFKETSQSGDLKFTFMELERNDF